jgi:poly-gamma-glutamate synthesis protein (capsule biosynthesis protein)
MFDRTIRVAIDQKGGDYLFSCIDPYLEKPAMVVGNLEGPITASSSVSLGSSPGDDHNFTFTFPTSTAELLKRHRIGIVNLGNNHIMNFGLSGLTQTKQYLSAAGVQYFGDPDASESDKVLRTSINGVDFSFVNWSDWTSDKTDHTVAQVQEEAESGRVVVVYTHWGVEYVPPIARVRELAHEFVDAGANIVIGSHPHIVQEHESYHGKDIYYSLGNFIFDQYFSDAVRHGLMLDVTFTKSGVMNVQEIPVELERDRTTCPAPQST